MKNVPTLWVPGTDHASIATEAKVVQKLKAQGKTKDELGRDKFLDEVWAWKDEFGGEITKQLRKIGTSCDWEKEKFTMDENLSKAVVTVFEKLYNEGLIYRGERLVNWCPTCKTSISDIEVEYEEEPSFLWHIRYPVENSKDEYVIVATTRPETMLGDTAVAVNPKDERYTHLVGKRVLLPIVNKYIPIVADRYVDMEFGTGVVKNTPNSTNPFKVLKIKGSLGYMFC
jgi:valine--tRNA ligase